MDSDRDFLFALYRTTMREVVGTVWGWDDEWQREAFEQRYGRCAISIIEGDGRALGGLWLESRADAVHITELQILPEWQGMGIGTAVVRGVTDEADTRGLSVMLSVVPTNPRAQRLYERLGFTVTHVEPPFIRMRHSRSATGKGD